jgi:hypothetical protein
MRVPLVGLVVAVLACGGNGSTPDSPYPDARLEIGYQHPDVESYSYVLTCQDDEARVEGAGIDAEAACIALSDLSTASRLVEGPPRDQACPEIYGGPDTATIQGTIDGSRVQTVVDRTDGCGISDWDNLLVDILPPARGVAEPP